MSEEFEKWWETVEEKMVASTGTAWDIWQASRKQALFEAATKCDEWGHHLEQFDSAKAATADTCAELIRELQQQ